MLRNNGDAIKNDCKSFKSGYMRANTIFKDLITSILENGEIQIMTSFSWLMTAVFVTSLIRYPTRNSECNWYSSSKTQWNFRICNLGNVLTLMSHNLWLIYLILDMAKEHIKTQEKLNSKSPEIQKAIVGKLDNIFMQRYPVYYMKDDAVRFGPSLSEMSAVQNYVSPNSVRKWRETANEQLADIKRDIASLPDRPSNPGKLFIWVIRYESRVTWAIINYISCFQWWFMVLIF